MSPPTSITGMSSRLSSLSKVKQIKAHHHFHFDHLHVSTSVTVKRFCDTESSVQELIKVKIISRGATQLSASFIICVNTMDLGRPRLISTVTTAVAKTRTSTSHGTCFGVACPASIALCTLHFMVDGHTKFAPWCFGLVKQLF